MAYPYFPNNNYMNNYQQPIIPQPNNQVNNSGIIWVQGEAGAKSYLVAPNTTVQLWDSEAETIYVKSADASGMPSIKILDYKIRGAENNAKNTPISAYATKEDITMLEQEISDLRAEFKAKTTTSRKTLKREEDSNE